VTETTLLLRQVHPGFLQNGRITSQVFRPTPKDERQLSCYNGDKIDALGAFQHFTSQPDCRSAGVVAVSKQECDQQTVPVIDDAEPFLEHCTIDFSSFSNGDIEKIAKTLKRQAESRGWLYLAGNGSMTTVVAPVEGPRVN